MTKRQIIIIIGEALIKSKLLCFCSCKGRLRCLQTCLRTVRRQEIDLVTGRYIQSDPIGFDGGVNTYLYVGGNPVVRVDESGKFAFLAPAIPFIEAGIDATLVYFAKKVAQTAIIGTIAAISTSSERDDENPTIYYHYANRDNFLNY